MAVIMPRSRSSSPEQSPRRSHSREPTKPCSLLVRQLNYNVKAEDVKKYFERFGAVKDVYLPSDFYTHKPRGFGFIEFENEKDAKDALEQSDGTEVLGSTVKVVFAREGRKTPNDMKRREEHYRTRRRSHSRDRGRHRSRSRSPRHRRGRSRSNSSNSYSRSRSPRRRRHSSSSGSRKRSS